MTRTFRRTGQIECRVTHQTDGRWLAIARRGTGMEGRCTTAYALGPAAAAQDAILTLMAREEADVREEAAWAREDAAIPPLLHHPPYDSGPGNRFLS